MTNVQNSKLKLIAKGFGHLNLEFGAYLLFNA